jgi:DNA-directed RNA polymerase subunit RPC12/RpoP
MDEVMKDRIESRVADVEPGGDLLDITKRFKLKRERVLAQRLWDDYSKVYTLERPAERSMLAELIYLEVIQRRYQDQLNDAYTDKTKAVPVAVLNAIHANLELINKLKTTLGMNQSKEQVQGYDAFQHFQRRIKVWLSQNQASRSVKCPHCQEWTLLKIRPEVWEAQRHPFFRDNRLYNKALYDNLGKTVVIDRNFIASVMEHSPDYVDWILQKYNQTQPTVT